MVLAGAKVRASDISRVQSKSKAATESVTSSTTLQDDDDLFFDMEVGKSYRVELHMAVSGATGGDIKLAWTVGGTVTKTSRSCTGPQLGTTDVLATSMKSSRHGIASSIPYGTDGTNESHIYEAVTIEDVTVAGTLQLQWAQNASSGTATTANTTSRIEWQEIDIS